MNVCQACGNQWDGKANDPRCPNCKTEKWNEEAGGEACGLDGGICDRCGCEFVTPIGKAHYCPNCGSRKWGDGPNIRPPNLWIREVVKPSGKAYRYYMATWREGGETKNFHIGSVRRLSPDAAREKARKLKLERLSPPTV